MGQIQNKPKKGCTFWLLAIYMFFVCSTVYFLPCPWDLGSQFWPLIIYLHSADTGNVPDICRSRCFGEPKSIYIAVNETRKLESQGRSTVEISRFERSQCSEKPEADRSQVPNVRDNKQLHICSQFKWVILCHVLLSMCDISLRLFYAWWHRIHFLSCSVLAGTPNQD